MKPARHVYRIGDHVTVMEPLTVSRVGYALSLEDGRKHVEPLVGKELIALFHKVGARLHGAYTLPSDPETVHVGGDRDYDRALSAIAHAYLRSVRYGGPKRTIHTQLDEALRGRECIVADKRCVKTGTYSPGWSGYDEESGNPPALSDEATHVLLELRLATGLFESPFEIEARNVRPITPS